MRASDYKKEFDKNIQLPDHPRDLQERFKELDKKLSKFKPENFSHY
jgi:hypothetical protein